MTFRLIEGGVFSMGSNRNDDEKPQDLVTVEDFYLGAHEVSRSQYKRFAEATERDFFETTQCTDEDCPMSYITWEDAAAYCEWLSSNTGNIYRLPSEAEWEYAARGGDHDTDDKFWWGNTVLENHENWKGTDWDRDDHLATVDSYKANPFGLYNMLGNVSEWTKDCYKNEYRGIPRDSSAYITDPCSERVIRGGNYVDDPKKNNISVTKRRKSKQTNKSDEWGFRVARQIEF